MSNIFLYAHGGSGNHGCEAIVRSTISLLEGHNISLISSKPEEDAYYGISALCPVIQDRDDALNRFSPDFFAAYAKLKLKKDFIPLEKLHYKKSFSHIKKGDIALSIGGDNYCYADVYKYTMLHDLAKSRGAKTVLWGCSVEPSALQKKEISADIARYDLITARETISYEALKVVNPNTVLVSDPAFGLPVEETEIPNGFVAENTVGINLSPMAMNLESVSGMAFDNYTHLIQHIIDHTDMQIALFPHVVWADNDDRIPLQKLYDAFADSGRVVMIQDQCCTNLKFLISKCRFFIGARTHATIAAYSTCVPTLVLGYSVKSRGIARDLFGTEEGYVLPVQNINASNELTDYFSMMMQHEEQIRDHLTKILPIQTTHNSLAYESLIALTQRG